MALLPYDGISLLPILEVSNTSLQKPKLLEDKETDPSNNSQDTPYSDNFNSKTSNMRTTGMSHIAMNLPRN